MITLPSNPRDDGFNGFLIDLDHAISTDETVRQSIPERTGTFEFMSTDALECLPGFRHTYYDDLQSFMWVFLWLIVEERPTCAAVNRWGTHNPLDASAIKAQQISSEAKFKHHFSGSFDKKLGQSAVQAAMGLRKVLWPVERDDLDRKEVITRLYEGVIKEFNMALEVAEGEAETLEKRLVAPRNRMAN